MNILITGAKGFIGKNLIAELNNIKEGKAKGYSLTPDFTLFEYDIDTDPALLDGYCREAELDNPYGASKKAGEDLLGDSLSNSFSKKLYSTYLSYLPVTGFSYPLKMNVDNRALLLSSLSLPSV